MNVPSFLSPFLEGESRNRLLQGLTVGVIATLIIGFSLGGWSTGAAVKAKVDNAVLTTTVSVLAPICADRFEIAAKANDDLVVKLTAVSSWQRNEHLLKAGYATFAGEAEPNAAVAEACSRLVSTAFKLQ